MSREITSPEYIEILSLHKMLKKADIPHRIVKLFDGWQVIYPNVDVDESIADAVEHFASYGGKYDRLELMGLLTDDELEVDSVKGFMTAEEVFERIKNHYNQAESKKELTSKNINVLPPSCSCEVCWLRDICEKKESCAKSVKKHLMMGKGKISKWLESEADEK